MRINGHILALDDGHEDGGGAGRNRNALSRADQLAVQLRNDQADGLGSAGAVRNDVLRAGAGTTQVTLALRAVQNHLVAGVGVHGGHDAGNDRIGIVQGLGHRGEAVGGAGRGGDHLVLLRQARSR